MQLSEFGKKITQKSGILELMEDISSVFTSDDKIYMLGGGNPAQIPEVNALWKTRMLELIKDNTDFSNSLTMYDSANPNFSLI